MELPNRCLPPPRPAFRPRRVAVVVAVACAVGCVLLAGRPAAARRLGEITDVAVRRAADGATEIRVSAGRTFRERDYSVYHLPQSPPRAVLRLRGVELPYEPREIEVGDANVVRITVGHDARRDPPELNLILELTSQRVRINRVDIDGPHLVIRVTGGTAAGPSAVSPGVRATTTVTPSPVVPAPSASPVRTPSATPTPTPSATPTPTPTATPTPTPTATATPSRPPTPAPTATPARRPSPTPRVRATRYGKDRTPPSADGAAGRPGPTTLYRASTTSEASPQRPDDGASAARNSSIAEIVVSQRPDGATLLRVTLADPIGGRGIRHRRDPGDPRRHEILIQGVGLGPAPPSIEVARPNLDGLGLDESRDRGVPELRLTLRLSSEKVAVERIAFQGPDVVILLEPPPGQPPPRP